MILFHYNPKLNHQVRHALAMSDAGVQITPSPDGEADIHIISGPHFALDRWRNHPRVIMIDRAYWGDPEYIRMGWLQKDGSLKYARGTSKRDRPACLPWKTREQSCLILADYGQECNGIVAQAYDRFGHVRVRRHPAEGTPSPNVSLESELMLTDVVVGHSSTALVEAIVLGVPVICTDPRNVVAPVSVTGGELYRGDREAWLHEISWHQFNHDEFGMALRVLCAQAD